MSNPEQHQDLQHQDFLINQAMGILRRRCSFRESREVHPDLYDLFVMRMAQFENEHFQVAYLDTLGRLIEIEEVSIGTLSASTVYPREIVKLAVKHNAAYAVLAHNHPSGTAKPSEADIILTKEIVWRLAVMDMIVADHIIVGGSKFYSFKAGGLL